MTDVEFSDWMADEVVNGRMTFAQSIDILEQKKLFEFYRTQIELNYRGRVAGYVDGGFQVADTVDNLFDLAATNAPGRMIYFEPVGFVLF